MPVLLNLVEKQVLDSVDEFLKKEGVCSCDQCKLDVAAIALNYLPTRYVVASLDAAYAKADLLGLQKYIDIAGAITRAVKLVKEHPRH